MGIRHEKKSAKPVDQTVIIEKRWNQANDPGRREAFGAREKTKGKEVPEPGSH